MCNPQTIQQQPQHQSQQQPQHHQHDHDQDQDQDQHHVATTTAYVLYLHREELRRRKVRSARSSLTKIQLTSELIARTKENIRRCSDEDLEILARETIFKKSLQRHLHYRRMQLQAWLMAKRQGKNMKPDSRQSQ